MNRSTKNWAALLAMMMMLFAFTGCSDDDGATNPGPTPLDEMAVVTAAADAYFTTYKIDVDGDGVRETGVNIAASGDLAANLDNYYVIDTRAAADFNHAHIPGSHNIPVAQIINQLDNLPTDKVLLFTCYTGSGASYVTAIINIVGTVTGHKAINLKYGMSQWAPLNLVNAAGTFTYPTSDDYAGLLTQTVYPKNAPGSLPTFTTGKTTEVEVLKARAQVAIDHFVAREWQTFVSDVVPLDPNTYLINYFPDNHYNIGHLPGAIQYRPPTASAPSELVSTAALNTLPTDRPIAIYCYTGQTSAQVAAYLAMLGYDAKSVMYGLQVICYNDATLNGPSTMWHGPDGQYPLTGTGVN